MSKAQNRVEKYKGVTLVVQDNWITVVLDGMGYEMAGPVASDTAVVAFTRFAIDALRRLVITMELE